jgi:hypothetical protein
MKGTTVIEGRNLLKPAIEFGGGQGQRTEDSQSGQPPTHRLPPTHGYGVTSRPAKEAWAA